MNMFRSDKISVFISSTIRECGEERDAARRAVLSLNHVPVMFEVFGARAHAPRDMYLRGIEESQIFLAIYKDSRGWIDNSMDVSGIEDEFRHASRRGMPRLVYMKEDAGTPPPWLGALANAMTKDNVSVFFFKDSESLFNRIRDDVEAVIAEAFYGRTRVELIRSSAPVEILDSLLPDATQRLRRPALEQAILHQLVERHQLVVSGPMGIGKTVLMAQLSVANGFVFLHASGLSTKETAALAARLLWEKAGQEAPRYLDIEAAAAGFIEAWKDAVDFTLVIDACDEPGFFIDLARRAGGCTERRRLLMSATAVPEVVDAANFVVPPLDVMEVRKLVSVLGLPIPSDVDLAQLVDRSRGNPLYLRYVMPDDIGQSLQSIEEYEKGHWLRLKPKAKELLTYVVLADQPLPLGSLGRLLGGDSIEEVDANLDLARHLLREERGGYTVVHEHLRSTLRSLLKSNGPKHAYYANRLAEQLVADEDYVSAFLVLDRAQDPKAGKIAQRAAFQAQIGGNVKASVRILESRAKYAAEVGDNEEQILALLALTQAKLLLGDKEGALQSTSMAEPLVHQVKDEALRSMFEQQKIMLALRIEPSPPLLQRLQEIKQYHVDRGDTLAAASASADLSEIFVRLGNYREAAAAAEQALAWFEAARDDYGASTAKANLAAALGAIPGEGARAAKLFKEIREEMDASANLRGKAWVCNMLARKLRHARKYDDALAYAQEAITLAEQLGDKYVSAVDRITLGNIHRDTGRLNEALTQYELAARTAQQASFRDLEAAASELVASVLNQKGEHSKAEQYARVAAGLVRGTAATHTFAKAMEELAESLLRRGAHEGIQCYLEGARAIAGNSNYVEYFYELGLEGLFAIPNDTDPVEYFEYIDELFCLDGPPVQLGYPEAFYYRVPDLLRRVDRNYVILVMGAHFYRLFDPTPPPAARFLLQKLISVILTPRKGETLAVERLLALIPLIAAVPATSWKPGDVVALGELLFSKVSTIAFKPHGNGAVHWVVRVGLATPVVCSVRQLDDGPGTALAATLLVLFLKGFEDEIQRQVILTNSVPRREVAINVMGVAAFRRHVTDDPHIRLPTKDTPCVVSRPTNPKDREQVPTIVICHDDIHQLWHAGEREGTAMQILFGLTLIEIVYQLFEGQVDIEALSSRIIPVVRRSVS